MLCIYICTRCLIVNGLFLGILVYNHLIKLQDFLYYIQFYFRTIYFQDFFLDFFFYFQFYFRTIYFQHFLFGFFSTIFRFIFVLFISIFFYLFFCFFVFLFFVVFFLLFLLFFCFIFFIFCWIYLFFIFFLYLFLFFFHHIFELERSSSPYLLIYSFALYRNLARVLAVI